LLAEVGLGIAGFLIWLIVLIKGSMPVSLIEANAAVLRFQARTSAYAMMLTGKYPGELFGEKAATSIDWPASSSAVPSPEITTSASAPLEFGVVPTGESGSVATGDGYNTDLADTNDASPVELKSPSAIPLRTTRLVLSRGAKRILVIFLILVGLGYAGEIAIGVSRGISSESSLISLQTANSLLGEQIASAEAQEKTCSLSQSACSLQYLKRLSSDFDLFHTKVSGISFPSSARADAARLTAESATLVSLLDQMTSGGATQAQVNRLSTLGNTFDSDYSQVISDLSNNSI
jgi:hypothetical protein